MGMLQRAWQRFAGREQKDDGLEAFRQIMSAYSESWSGKNVTLRTALQVSTAFACGRVISEGIATMPLRIMRDSFVPDLTHPLYDKLITVPNPLQSAFEFKETLGFHLAFCGNGFVWTPRVSGNIDALYLLEPRWMTVKYDWPQPPTYVVRTDGGSVFTLQQSEVWHVKGPSWTTYLGMEFIKVAREALGLSMAIEESQARMHGQGVRTTGYIATDGVLQEDQHAKLTKWIEEQHSGSWNAGRPMILDRAAKWIQTNMSNVDAQTAAMREVQVEEVCRFMRVNPIMVGVMIRGTSYASAEQMFLAHLVHTLGPWTGRIESSADRWLLSDKDRKAGRNTKFNDRVLHRMTALDAMNYLQKGTYAGILTRNEARNELGYTPINGLDDPLTPVNEVAGPPPTVESMKPPAPLPPDKTPPPKQPKSKPIKIVMHWPATMLTLNQEAPRLTVERSEVNVAAAALPAPQPVVVNNHIDPAPVHINLPEVRVEPTPVHIDNQVPQVTVNNVLPEYTETETEAVRDSSGRLSKTITRRKRK